MKIQPVKWIEKSDSTGKWANATTPIGYLHVNQQNGSVLFSGHCHKDLHCSHRSYEETKKALEEEYYKEIRRIITEATTPIIEIAIDGQ